jgi:hypothetical protein
MVLGQVSGRFPTQALRRVCAALAADRKGRSAGDPWCLGYFSGQT